MAKTFDQTVKLIKRIPDLGTTKYLFRSLLDYLHPDDQALVIEHLMEVVTRPEKDVQKCA
jgi:hypothetical protein